MGSIRRGAKGRSKLRYGPPVAGNDAEVLEVAGREVRLSSPGKVLFAERSETKRDLVDYYRRVGQPLMRTMGGRPVLMQRFPRGAGGPSFFQKRVPQNAPEWLRTTTVTTVNGTPSRALVIADPAHVVWAVNLGCLGFHVWPYRAEDPEHCDELRLDLDPQPGTDFTDVRRAAVELKALLDELDVVGYPKTTGNRGLHVYVRLLPRWDSYAVRAAAVAVARELDAAAPTSSRRRGGRRSAARGSSSTTTRTHRTRPSSARGPCVPVPAARSPHRCAGRTSPSCTRTS